MMSDANRYDLKIGEIFLDNRTGRSITFEITEITPDGNLFELRWADMSEDELCPYVTAERIFEIANIDESSRRRFTHEEMLLAFAAGFQSSAKNHNGERNDFTKTACASARELLSINNAKHRLGREFSHFLEQDIL